MNERDPRRARGSGSGGYYAVIPADVRYDRELNANAKLLYGEITSLCGKTGYCWAPNEYFAQLYGLSERTISRMVSQLERRGYIRCEMAGAARGSERRIYAGILPHGEEARAEDPEDPAPGEDGAALETGPDAAEADNSVYVQGGVDKSVQGGVDNPVERGVDKIVQQNNKTRIIKQEVPPLTPPGGTAGPDELRTGRRARTSTRPPRWRPEWFDTFWAAYPRKDGKQAAARAWDKLSPDRALCGTMWLALERAKRSRQWVKDDGEYIPHFSTWLNGRQWEDQGVDRSQLPDAPADGFGGWAPDPEVTR